MRMKTKMGLFIAGLVAGLPVSIVVAKTSNAPENALATFGVWLLLFMLASFFPFFDCPHCGKRATIRPDGTTSPAVGTQCRYCHRDY